MTTPSSGVRKRLSIEQVLDVMSDFFHMATVKYLEARRREHREVMQDLARGDFSSASELFGKYSDVTYDGTLPSSRVDTRNRMFGIFNFLSRTGTIRGVVLKGPLCTAEYDSQALNCLRAKEVLNWVHHPIVPVVRGVMKSLPNLEPYKKHQLEIKVKTDVETGLSRAYLE